MVKADVALQEEVQKMFKMIKKENQKLDILVNNAGIVDDGLLTLMSNEKFNNVINTNLEGFINVTKAALLLRASKKIMAVQLLIFHQLVVRVDK